VGKPNEASAALNGKYEIIGLVPGPIAVYSVGEVDLREISLETADLLYSKGVPYLKKVEKATDKK
jgi:hypothetical protein